MSDHQSESISQAIDIRNNSGIVRNPDGTYTRFLRFPSTPATPEDDGRSPALSKDVPLNPENQTWVRIFLPRQALDSFSSTRKRKLKLKLPLIFYYHGGGFVFMSAASTMVHDHCAKLAAEIDAVVISVEYRLTPEHRLPAAYEDAIEALRCMMTTQEQWLTEFADFSNCFLMGSSAGANIAYNAGLAAAAEAEDLDPLQIKGLILHHPFFGGSEPTASELRLANGPVLTLPGTNLLWELSLPIGADRDHEYCNPTLGGGSDQLERIRFLGWRILVTGCFGDLLIDRQMELSKLLEEKSVQTVSHFGEGYHGIEIMEPLKATELFLVLKKFIRD